MKNFTSIVPCIDVQPVNKEYAFRALLTKINGNIRHLGIMAMVLLCSISAQAQSTSFTVVGAYTYTVAPGVYTLGFDVAGSGGGTYGTGNGGLGGRVQGLLSVTPGQVLYIYVGGAGSNGSGGAGGVSVGGEGGGVGGVDIGGAGGGAACDIRTSIAGGATSAASLNSRVVVGGGGGGGDWDFSLHYNGGGGGYPNGGNGSGDGGGTYAQGGSQTAGGAAGSIAGGTAGGFGPGGNSIHYAGGGGGGWYGGGGGYYGSGAGGSSTFGAGTSAVTTTNNFRAGTGYVTLCAYPSVGGVSVSPSSTLCVGSSGTLSTTGTAAGTWSSTSVGVASITGTTVTGVSLGTSTISYTAPANACVATPWAATTVVTVFATPAAISGASTLCGGSTMTLSDVTTGGVWISSNTVVATVASASATTAVVTGLSGGTTTISYGSGCYATKIVTVTGPAAISGASYVMVTSTISLSDATGGGTWSSSNPAIGSVSGSGVVTGVSVGTITISYTVAGCSAIKTVVVGAAPPPTCTTTSLSWGAQLLNTSTFSATGGLQTWLVPTGVTSITADIQGATGGGVNGFDTYQSIGGKGGRVQIDGSGITVIPGHTLNIIVGTQGSTTGGGGYGGGGSDLTFSSFWPGAGGGGYSGIFDAIAPTTPLVIAGGGGGGGGDGAGGDIGGAGGGTCSGCIAGTGASLFCGGTTGGGGGSTVGGAGGCTGLGNVGSSLTGANVTAGFGSGGGGGGYFGGGGGYNGGGGGGGSSYINPTFSVTGTTTTFTQGYNSTGGGSIAINYLTPITNTPTYGINTFSISATPGPNLVDAGMVAAATAATGYIDRTGMAMTNLYAGGSYPSTITWGTATAYQEAQVWIDFNNNGTFETSEEVTGVLDYSTVSTTSPFNFNIVIPTGAAIGAHLMRIRGIVEQPGTYALSSHLDPCLKQYGATGPIYNFGDAADYIVNIQAPPPCSGTPTAGVATVSPTSGGPATSFTLTLTGYSVASGISFQWESSPDGTTWTPIAGATTTTYSFTGISANTYFHCVVTCAFGGSATTGSTLATFSIPVTCTPTAASWNTVAQYAYGASLFTITGYSGSNLNDAAIQTAISPTTAYAMRYPTIPTVNLQQGGVYASSVNWNIPSGYQYLQVWIDFNNNGTFEPSEEVSPVSGYSTGAASPTAFNITIPGAAATGLHLMRMRAIWEQISTDIGVAPAHMDPCLINYGAVNPRYWSGTATDYYANIVPLACTGTPTAGSISPATSFGCGTVTPTLTLTGSTSAPGIVYQWQSAPPPGTVFTDIPGATATSYSPSVSSTTYFRTKVICTASSSTVTATSVIVSVNPVPSLSSASNNSPVCVGGTFTLTANSPSNVAGYSWSGPAAITGATSSLATVATTTVSAGGTYTVTVNNGSGPGCSVNYTTIATVNPTPTIVGLNFISVCDNPSAAQDMRFSYGSTTGGANQFTLTAWSPAGLGTIPTFTTLPTAPATYTVTGGVPAGTAPALYTGTFTIKNSSTGCTSSSSVVMTVNVSPVATFSVQPGATTCAGVPVTYASQTGYSFYVWNIPGTAGIDYTITGGSTSPSSPTVTITWITTGSKTVTCQVFNTSCQLVQSSTTNVTTSPSATVASTGSPICVPGTATLTATPIGTVTGYSWTGPSAFSSTLQNPPVTPTVTSTYTLTVSNGSCSPTTIYTTTVTVNNPTAAPFNNGPICSVGTVTLTANPSGGVTGYSWTGPGGFSSASANPTATPTTTTTYSLTVSMPGCSPTTVYTTSVTVNPAPTAAPTNNGPICGVGTATLTAAPSGGPTTYSWTGPLGYSSSLQNPPVSPTVTTTYSLTVSSAGCFPATVYTTTVTVNNPTALVSNTGPSCGVTVVTLNAIPAGGTTGYSWTGPGGFASALQNPTLTPTITGTYSLTVSMPGCSPATVYTTTITVANPTAAPNNNGPVCSVGTVTLTANPSGGATTYSWTGPSGFSSSLQNPTASPTIVGVNIYSLTVGGPGCTPSSVYTTAVTVTTPPSATATSTSPICIFGTATLTATPIGGATGYSWTGPGGFSSALQVATATPTVTSTYSLTVSSAGCFPTTVYTTTVTVNNPTALVSNTGPSCGVTVVTLNAIPAGGTTGYSWTGPGGFASAAQNPTVSPTVTSTYSLTVSMAGCSPATVYTTTVTVNNPAAAPLNNGPVCSVGTVTLTANPSGGATTYSWSGPGGFTSTVQNPTANPTIVGINIYSLSVGAPGCTPTTVYTTAVTVTTAPTAAPTNGGPICNGGTVNLTAGGTGATGYSWTGPGGYTSTQTNPSVTPTTTSTYSLTVSSGSCVQPTIYTTLVSVNPTPGAAPINNGPICSGGSATLTATPSGGATVFAWTGPSSYSSASQNPVVSPTITTTYSLTVSSGAASGCSPSTIYTTTVTVNPATTAAPTSGGPICVTGTATLFANASGVGPFTYSWTGPGGFTSSVANPTPTPTTTTTYSLVVTSPSCLPSQMYTVVATVASQPTASAANSGVICASGTVTLTATPTGGSVTTYAWTGSSITGGGATATATATPGVGTTVYTITVTDGTGHSGCSSQANTTVTVNATPTVSASNSGYICVGGTATLTATTTGGTVTTYAWTGPSITGGGTTATATATAPLGLQTYTVTVSDGSGRSGCSSQATTITTVNAVPTATATNSGYICSGGTVTLNATSITGTVTTYAWTGSSIVSGASSSTATANPSTVGTGTYTLTVSDGTHSGCTSQSITIVTVNATPTASAANSGVICAGGTVTLTATPTGGSVTTYAWTGASITGGAATATATATPGVGTTVYTITVTDGSGHSGCSTQANTTVTVNATPTVSASNSGYICVGGTATLTATTTGGTVTTYAWTGTNITGGAGTATATAAPAVVGTSTYTVVVSDGTARPGCSSQATTIVTVNAVPTATASNSGYICAGGTATLTATLPSGTITTYAWTGSSIVSGASSSTATANPSTVGTGTYTLTVSDGTHSGCTSQSTTIVTVNATPTASAANSGVICAGGTVTLTATPTGGSVTTYAWTGVSITGGAATATATATPGVGTSIYTITVTDGSGHPGCSTQANTTVTVNATPTASASNSGYICVGGTATLTATTTGGSVTTYAWTGTNITGGAGTATATAAPAVVGTSTYTVVVSDGTARPGCSSQATTIVTVNAVPTATATNSGYICAGGTATLTATLPSGTITTYAWTGSSIVSGASSSTATANPSTVGTGTYTLTVSDGTHSGCTSQSTTIVTVNATPTASAANSGVICAGGTVTLTATPTGGSVTTYAWTGASITGGAATATATATPGVGTSIYTITVTDGSGHPGCSTQANTTVTVNATPTASASNSGYICVGGTATLTATPTGGSVTTYAWTGTNITGGAGTATATAAPAVVGTSTYTVVVSDGTARPGCSSQATTIVTVNAAPTATATNNGYICVSGTVTLTATAATGGVTAYAWTGTNIISGGATATATASPSVVGTSVYTLTVSNGTAQSGCTTQSTTIVTVNAAATATATNSGYICAGGTATLTATAVGAGVTTYAWAGTNILSGAGSATATANPSVIGTTTYTLTVSDGGAHSGCISQSTTIVTVNAAPSAIATNTGFICVGGTVTLNATALSGGATSFTWAGSNILTGGATATATAAPAAIGNTTYTLTVSDGGVHPGCVSQSTTIVTVNPTPTAAPTNDGPICIGGTVTLTANGANGASTFTWTGANILGSTASSVTTANPGTASVYSLTVSDGSGHSGCTSPQYTTTVSVNAVPTASAINTGYICNGGTVTLAAIPANGASEFAWTGPNLAANTGMSVQATPTTTTTYSLTVSNGAGSGCQPTTVYTTTVIVHVTPTAAPSNDGPICIGGTVNLAANPSASATVFVWNGVNMSSTSVANPTATPTITGTYTVVVSDGTTQSGCAPSTQYTTTVTVKSAPSLSGASNNSPICATNTLDLFANDALNVTDYLWSGPVPIDNKTTNHASVPAATTAASGTYTVVVNNGTGSGCAISYMTQATVNPLPSAFDVTGGGAFCAGDTGVHVGLSGSVAGITYHLYQDATATTSLAGTGSALDFGAQTVQATYSVLATNDATGCNNNMNGSVAVTVNPLPNNTYVLLGSGVHYCMGGSGILMTLNGSDTGISYQLFLGSYTTGSALLGTGSPLNFGYQTGGGNYVALATNVHTGCRTFVSGIADVIIDSLPRIYSLTGGGSYCENGTGVDIGLSSSDTGITYVMTNSGDLAHPVTLYGTGTAVDFGLQTAAGTVTVVATNNSTTCTSTMAGNPAVSINPLPNIYNVRGGGTYCEGTGGVDISMNTSDTAVMYYLYNGASLVASVAGTGGPVSFGPQTAAGIYSASATRVFTGCSDTMAMRAQIIMNLTPTIYTVTGGGAYCSADAGIALGLGGSDTGVTYTLYNLAASVYTVVGTGSPLGFGTYAAGSYSVSASNNTTGCVSNMSGVRVITMNMTPVAYNVGGGGRICAGGPGAVVTLSTSDTGVSYKLYDDASLVGTFAGTGSLLSFGSYTVAGTYTVAAVSTAGCANNMADSAVVVVVTPVTPSITVGSGSGDTTCAGSSVTFTANGLNGGSTPVYNWSVNSIGVPTVTGTTYTYIPGNGDIVTVTMTSNAECASPATVSASDTMTVLTQGTPVVTINVNPGTSICANTTVTFTAIPAFGGAHPTFKWMLNGAFVHAGPEYSYTPVNNDNVTVEMTSDYPCLTTDTATNHVVMNVGEAVAPVVNIVAIPGTTIMQGAQDTLIAYVDSAVSVTYQWIVNSSVIAGATTSVFIQTFSNGDSVTCQVTSTNGCALSGFNTVRINVINVGVQPVVIGEANIRLIPNPNNGEFTVNGTLGTTADQDVNMEVTDMLGQVIYKGQVTVHNGMMNEKIKLGNTLANGMYMMNISAGGEHRVFHFVIEK